MIRHEREAQGKTLACYFAGFCFLTIAFLAPDAGNLNGRSFFIIVSSSPWETWGDWAAAWCSLKVIFLSLGVFLVLRALESLFSSFTRKSTARILLTLIGAPIAGFGLGVYYLIKSVF